MKLGLFGGTFDPIHWGHLRSAEEVREVFALDRVLFIPASQPPQKKTGPGTSARDRLQMVRLAVAKNRHFAVSAVEISRPGVSYSIDTIRHFAGRQTARDSLFFILGLDAFQEIGSWKEYEKLFPLCDFIVTSRPGSVGATHLRRMPVAVRKLFCYDSKKNRYRHRSGTYLHFIKITDIAISASEIRRRARNGKSIRYLVPLEVESYIHRRGLYRGRRGGQ
jgi:nicotinate-nucleotide adenylyltransferase